MSGIDPKLKQALDLINMSLDEASYQAMLKLIEDKLKASENISNNFINNFSEIDSDEIYYTALDINRNAPYSINYEENSTLLSDNDFGIHPLKLSHNNNLAKILK